MISGGERDAFLLKYSSDGQLILHLCVGSTGFDSGTRIAIEASNIYWAGTFQDTITVGSDSLIASINNAIFLIKLDTSGNYIWAKQLGGPSADAVTDLSIDNQNNITISTLFRDLLIIDTDTILGNTSSTTCIAKFDNNGQLNWTYTVGGTSSSICHDKEGNLYLSAAYQTPFNLNGQLFSPWAEFDAFVLSLNPNGQFRWIKSFSGPDEIMTRYSMERGQTSAFCFGNTPRYYLL